MAKESPVEIQKSLAGIDYPVSKQDLINHAKNNGSANDDILNVLNEIPDQEYKSPADVSKAIGKVV